VKTLSIRLPDPLARWVTQRAHESGRTQSEIVRDLLEREQNSKRKSIGQALSALGTFKGIHSDVSANKKYLEGYGE
jgi:hypothetical protein